MRRARCLPHRRPHRALSAGQHLGPGRSPLDSPSGASRSASRTARCRSGRKPGSSHRRCSRRGTRRRRTQMRARRRHRTTRRRARTAARAHGSRRFGRFAISDRGGSDEAQTGPRRHTSAVVARLRVGGIPISSSGDSRWARTSLYLRACRRGYPRQLRREDACEGLRAGRCVGGDRRCDRAPDRRLRHDGPVVARRLPDRGAHHRRRAAGEPRHPDVPYTGDRSVT